MQVSEPVYRNVESNLWLPKTHPRLKFPFPNTTSSLSDEAMFAGAATVDTVSPLLKYNILFYLACVEN